MKIVIVTDFHFGKSEITDRKLSEYLDQKFFSYLEQNKINTIFHLGDVFDSRKGISALAGNNYVESFLNPIVEKNIELHQILGNHDIFFNNDNSINSPNMFFNAFKKNSNLNLIKQKTEIVKDNCKFIFIPWGEKGVKIDDLLGDVILCHSSIIGFEMQRGVFVQHGLSQEVFKNFNYVFSGHFHRMQVGGNVIYPGSLIELSYGEHNISHGFVVFDTESNDFEFVKSDVKIFEKVIYKDDESIEIPIVNDKIIKVVAVDVKNKIKFDKFMQEIYDNKPYDVRIEYIDIEVPKIGFNDVDIENCDIMNIMRTEIDKIKNEYINKEQLKKLAESIYNETLIDKK
jgi:DNA repair exonuclease SbcCD nuclease subunit